MIPASLDYHALLADLNAWGIRDYKIEAICGFPEGCIAKLKCGATKRMIYDNGARLYNFWEDEARARGIVAPRGTSSLQPEEETAT